MKVRNAAKGNGPKLPDVKDETVVRVETFRGNLE
jgi:hypothetical protein